MTYTEWFREKVTSQKEFAGNPSSISGFWIFVIGAAVGAFFAPIALASVKSGQKYLIDLVKRES